MSGEDLTFWWMDSPMQPTTMAMLIILDRTPDERLLRKAFERAVVAVPRLTQRVATAPFTITLPHWEPDPTFDLDYHLRRHALPRAHDLEELFREIAPVYEAPFDRSRPLWEARIYEGLADGQAALFFKLHHAVADGVGANAIFAAMTDACRDDAACVDVPPLPATAAGWASERGIVTRVAEAVRDRIELDVSRVGSVATTMVDAVLHPTQLGRALEIVRSITGTLAFDSGSPLRGATGRKRRMTGIALPFAQMRRVKHALGGTMIDVILATMALAMGRWHAEHGLGEVAELMTLVPVNLRPAEQWGDGGGLGNRATGILVPLPIRIGHVRETYEVIRSRMAAKKADPASHATPAIAEILSALPRGLVSWMTEATFSVVDFIVTNVPGVLVPRYMAGAEILAAYPFAPVARHSPLSVALYGYRDALFVGLDADEATMPDLDRFTSILSDTFAELCGVAGVV
ncbi:MAG TPA: wax ester/triacylglycerol synthase family O-acyltransferase [Candidatus Binatia bacterium]